MWELYERLDFKCSSRASIPSAGKMGPTVIEKSQPIESIGSRLVTIRVLLILVFAHGPTIVGPYQWKGYIHEEGIGNRK